MKIGIIGAMDVEIDRLKEASEITRKVVKADMEFCEGRLGSTDVVIAKCGMGKVNSGICAQILIDTFNVSHVINTGVAGALNDNLNIGDIVIAHDAVQHDFDVTHLGFKAVLAVVPDVNVIEGKSLCRGSVFIEERKI